MEIAQIFVIGSGKLANAILGSNLIFNSIKVERWEPKYKELENKAIIVHAGSGRQLDECLEYCTKTKSILIELSTGLDTEKIGANFPLVICPNTSILLLKTIRMLKLFGSNFENYDISIVESHQATKSTEPGTAYNFANFLKVKHDEITSIRDAQTQLKIGIPKEFLERHAYHKIVIKDFHDEVSIETKVLGHNSYVDGVRKIIETCIKHKLENKKYTVLDLIEEGIL